MNINIKIKNLFLSILLIISFVSLSACSHSRPGGSSRGKDYSNPQSQGVDWVSSGGYLEGYNFGSSSSPVRYHYILSQHVQHNTGIGSVPTKNVDFENVKLADYNGKCGYNNNLRIFDDNAGKGSQSLSLDGLNFGVYFDFTSSYISVPGCFSWHGITVSSSDATMKTGLQDYHYEFSSPNGKGSGGSKQWLTMYWQTPAMVNGKLVDTSINFDKPTTVHSIDINNNIYTALTIEQGSSFSKPFASAHKDWFIVRIKAYDSGNNQIGIMEVLLADFVNQPNYVLKDWNRIPLKMLGNNVSSLHFDFLSSDIGAYGINTPTYLLIDNVVIDDKY